MSSRRYMMLLLVLLLVLEGALNHAPSAAYNGTERLYYTGDPIVPGCFPNETQLPLMIENLDTTSAYTFEAMVLNTAFQPYMTQRFTQTPAGPGGPFTMYLMNQHDFVFGQHLPAAFPLSMPVTIAVQLCSDATCAPGTALTGTLIAGYNCQQGTYAWYMNWSRDSNTNTCGVGASGGLFASWFVNLLCP